MVRRLPIFILLALLANASSGEEFDCSAYYGLNVCATTFDLPDDQVPYSEEGKNAFSSKIEQRGSLFGTSLTDDDMDQMQKENAFKNTDSFRAYMKTLDNPASTSIDDEFSVKTKILDNTNFGLDCRLVANTIYELSTSNYYDCAVQRKF